MTSSEVRVITNKATNKIPNKKTDSFGQFETLCEEEESDAIFGVLETLTPPEKEAVRILYGFADGEETLEFISKLFGITRERARQIVAKALRKLRHPKRLWVFEEIYQSRLAR